jgi:hypothetical protein
MTQPAPVPVAGQVEPTTAPGCRHHWVIQPATGPISPGECQLCGETREFKNYVEASTWGDDKSASRASARVNSEVTRAVPNIAAEEDEGEE